MPDKTRAFVLRSIPYSDSSMLINCFSRDYGMTTYMVRGLNGRKSRFHKSQFLVLSELEIIARHRKGKVNTLREVKIIRHYEHLHTHIVKQSIALFIGEFIYRNLRDEHINPGLYDYLGDFLQSLDASKEKSGDFPLLFLMELTRHLGIHPGSVQNNKYFDLQEGAFTDSPHSEYWLEGEDLALFKRYLGTKFAAIHTLKSKAGERRRMMDILLLYFRLHLPSFHEPNAKDVLYAVFHT